MDAFVPFLILIFALGVVLRIDFFFTIFYLFAAVYLLSRFWMGRIKHGLTAELRFASPVFIGSAVALDVTLKNTSWLPVPWIVLIMTLPPELTAPWQPDLVHLKATDERKLSYSFTARKRGYYPIGPLRLTTGDVFGVVPRYQVQVAPHYLTVYPRIIPLQALGLPTRSPLAVLASTWPLFEDTSRVTGVRAYEMGDSPRNIHWTASASAGTLLVKRYQPAVARNTLIFLDLTSGSYDQRLGGAELAIVTAASVAYHVAVREKLPVGFACEAYDPRSGTIEIFHLPPRSERAHLIQVLEILARVSPSPDSSLIATLRRERARLAYGTTLVVITGGESVALFETLILLQRAGFAIALILVQPRSSSTVMAAPRGITMYRVWNEQDLEIRL